MKLSIVERTFPTPDSVTLRFKPEKTLEQYKAGQHGVFTLNIDSSQIHEENFFIPETSGTTWDISTLHPREVIVKLREEEKLIFVDAGSSILQAALRSNVKITYSCAEGQCGMCRAFLLSGEVKLRKNHVLTEDELKHGEILLCQGFPFSDNVSVRPVN